MDKGYCQKDGCGLRFGPVPVCGCRERCLAHCDCPLAEAAKRPGRDAARAIATALESGKVRLTVKP